MNEVERLMLLVGSQLGRSEQEIRPLIKKVVEDSWYDSLDSLRALSDPDWPELGLPPRFRQALQAKLKVDTQLTQEEPSESSRIQPTQSNQSIDPFNELKTILNSSNNACRSHALRILTNLQTGDPKYQKLNTESAAFMKMTTE